MSLYSRLLVLKKEIENKENRINTFTDILQLIQDIQKQTKVNRKNLKFISNIVTGLVNAIEEFTEGEIRVEINRILKKFEEIKKDLVESEWNGIFRVSSRKSYLNLEPEYFVSLARFQGYGKVLQNLINLKLEDPEKIAWVDERINYLVTQRDRTKNKGSFKEQLEMLKALNKGVVNS